MNKNDWVNNELSMNLYFFILEWNTIFIDIFLPNVISYPIIFTDKRTLMFQDVTVDVFCFTGMFLEGFILFYFFLPCV